MKSAKTLMTPVLSLVMLLATPSFAKKDKKAPTISHETLEVLFQREPTSQYNVMPLAEVPYMLPFVSDKRKGNEEWLKSAFVVTTRRDTKEELYRYMIVTDTGNDTIENAEIDAIVDQVERGQDEEKTKELKEAVYYTKYEVTNNGQRWYTVTYNDDNEQTFSAEKFKNE